MTACAPQATPTVVPTAAPTGITLDGLGREVKLAAPAQHVVSLAPSNTEILFAIGAGSHVVGRDEFSDYPAEAASVASVGGSMGQYSAEAIVALKPDLVLAMPRTSTSTAAKSLRRFFPFAWRRDWCRRDLA